ncbi:MAG: dihydrodipicolinate synthase family protein [Spirochaetaceae bacterium]|nr:MAG: dihydrodipicolinate synthase family protein [Spirochaetaceae bacterium]
MLSSSAAQDRFKAGTVIPAVPLALHEDRSFDRTSQQAVIRYYLDAGAGGLAVGVHTTQFELRDTPGFLEEILTFTSRVAEEWCREDRQRPAESAGGAIEPAPPVMIAGICGERGQAVEEARLARRLGFHAGLLSLAALKGSTPDEWIEHAARVGDEIPVIGFYLQTAVGGVALPYEFWRRFCEIDNAWGIKVAPFNRYATLEVVRGVAESSRAESIALYTGNDDSIVVDLLTTYEVAAANGLRTVQMVGGLLGHWSCWTRRAVEIHQACRAAAGGQGDTIPHRLLTLAAQITDMNSAVFDAANGYAGCIAGVHEVLRRQGLFSSTACLSPNERLSPGQAAAIDRVCAAYPHLTDDEFVRENLELWRS